MLQGGEGGTERARRLRQEMSLPEVLLWCALRTRPGGFKFRKQHPAGPFTADFYCHVPRLIVEVDGEAHGRGDRPERDALRDRWCEQRGLGVMRVPAAAVLADVDAVVRGIVDLATTRVAAQE